jgi:hypothetical protein
MRFSLSCSRPARLAAFVLFALSAPFAPAAKKVDAQDDFMPYVELAPFVVNGKQFSISVHARSKGDRRYAEALAEEVVKVVAESVTEETGKGLVIIGKKGEPHPIFVFRKFLVLAKGGKLDPAVAARGPELFAMLNHWQDGVGDGKSVDSAEGSGVDLEFEKIVTALPLPLEGIGAKLYQLAWAEGFDDGKVEAKLRALRPADLEGNMFARFDWVFYLPPRGAFEQAIDDLIADELKKDKAGFMERMMVKGVMLTVKPMIRKVIEAMRRGIMFSTVVDARTEFSAEDVSSLTSAYINALAPEKKDEDRSLPEHERAVKAVREQVEALQVKTRAEALVDETETGKPAAAQPQTAAPEGN